MENSEFFVGENGETYIEMEDGSLQLATAATIPPSTAPTIAASSSKEYWSDNDIKYLINTYKTEKYLFDSNSVKNDDIWKTIEMEMKEHGVYKNSTQIKNKMNNMKQCYKKAKDNDKSTGAAPSRFKYMELFDDVFGCGFVFHMQNRHPGNQLLCQ